MKARRELLRARLEELRSRGIDVDQLVAFARFEPDRRIAAMEEFQDEIAIMRAEFSSTRNARRGHR